MSRDAAPVTSASARTPPPMFGRPPMAGMGMPTQKAKDFKGSVKRLLAYLRPHRAALVVVVICGVIGTIFTAFGPRLLGLATTAVFEGYIGKQRGVPGAGIDFVFINRLMVWLVALYLIANFFQYLMQYLMANVAQKTVHELRREVESKFDRLPLKFFDSRTRGELMSRATNDLDSISGTLQQNLTQLLTSSLSVFSVVIMMLSINWMLTLGIVLTVPLSATIVMRIAKRSQKFFMEQQQALGAVNGHVAEMYSGHTIVTAFGHGEKAVATFDRLNARYYEGAWKAQFVTGIMMPTLSGMMLPLE